MRGRRRTLRAALACGTALVSLAAAPAPADSQETHALVVVGLGGDATYRERFHEWASRLHDALAGRLGSEERVAWLAEKPEMDPARIGGPATREAIETWARETAAAAGEADRVLVVLVGHGTSRGDEALFNLPGPDLSAADLDALLDLFPTQQVAVVNAASASGPFVEALSGPGRTVVTATRTAQERNETWFGRFFADALSGDGADLDKDGAVSLLEAFEFARRGVERHYQEQNLLLTEHAMLDDDGDGKGSAEAGGDGADGALARTFVLGSASAAAAVPADVSDPALRALHEERAALQRRMDALRARRGSMDPEAYDRELESLLIEIALVDRKIREGGGGGAR